MALIIGGKFEDVRKLRTLSWHDDPRLRLKIPEDGRRRKTTWVRSLILHSTRGVPGGRDQRPQRILPGAGPSVDAGLRAAHWWSTSSLQSGAHLVVDFDCTVSCLADLQNEVAFHAGPINEVSIGIEIYQGGNAELYEDQLDAVVLLCDYLTKRFGIQRQFHWPYHGGPIERLSSGGLDCVGIFGHRDVTGNRGLGDPGDAIFERLRAAGYEAFDFGFRKDVAVWRIRQQALALEGRYVDGIPGPATHRAAGKRLYVRRPGDP